MVYIEKSVNGPHDSSTQISLDDNKINNILMMPSLIYMERASHGARIIL